MSSFMGLRRLLAVTMIACCLGGCALSFLDSELNNRGGYLDSKADDYWFIADTKQMRVLRAYVVIGSLARMSRENFYKSEREVLIQHINSAVNVANDTFACAYAYPGTCVYFDERITELEVAALRIAIAVFTSKENDDMVNALSKQISDMVPLLKPLDSAAKLIDALSSTGQLAVIASKAVESLFKLGKVAYTQGRRAGALYRDSLELQMVAVISSLKYHCAWTAEVGSRPTSTSASDEEKTYRYFYPQLPPGVDSCAVARLGMEKYMRGAGDLSDWRAFLMTTAEAYRGIIVPDKNAFVQASDLVWRACEQITDDIGLIARCIGRREKKAECGCNEAGDCKGLANRTNTGAGDSCPLIQYFETRDQRWDRVSQARARLHWLSLRPKSTRMSLAR